MELFFILGRVKTPKSILLPSIVKALTNNTEIITSLNKLGHGIAYTQLMEIQTENAYMIVDKQKENGTLLLNALKEIFSLYVADNIDRNEETLTGIISTKICNISFSKSNKRSQFHWFNYLNDKNCLSLFLRHRNYT